MNKSYRVKLSPEISFKNERGPHVETDEEGLNRKTFQLGKRTEVMIKKNLVVMYDVIGVQNRGRPAHITVYFGLP
jgi:hypothetical protein